MKAKKRFLSILLCIMMVLGLIPTMSLTVYADDAVGSSWTVDSDGALSLSETAANKAVGALNQGNMILIGTKGGTITSLPSGDGIVTKMSTSENAAMIRYATAADKATIVNAVKGIKFSSDTTQVHIDVTLGDTTESMSGPENFGVLNADGEAHVYKLINNGSPISWIDAFDKSVKATDTIGGLKGYLATVTTADEANMVKGFYNSTEAGTWIGGTSLHYSTDPNVDYDNAGKVTPSNYSPGGVSVSNQKISANDGTYYCPFPSGSVSSGSYYDYYYWACGPEQGQPISTSLWTNNEPNNADDSRGGETCIVSPWGGNAKFNDFSPFNTVTKYFVEFSAYSEGLAPGASYNSITVYKVTFDGNGATGSIAPMEKFKGENLTLPTDYTGFTIPSGSTQFAGWFDANNNLVATYADDAPTTFYAHWLNDPTIPIVTANNRTYDGTEKPLVTVEGEPTGGTMQYVLGTDATTAPTDGWNVSIPSGTNAGTYYVWYKVVGDNGYLDSELKCVTVTITEVPAPSEDVPTGFVKDVTGTSEASGSYAFGQKIVNNDNLKTLLSLSDEEVNQGTNVWLDVTELGDKVSETDKALIDGVKGDYTVGLYLDINLYKKVGNSDAVKITKSNGKVKVSILIPEKLWKSERTFEIIRIHEGVATVIPGSYDENTHVFTFETDEFSTYAIAYKDAVTPSSDSGSSPAPVNTTTIPKTDGNTGLGIWYLLLAMSASVLGLLVFVRIRKEN